MYNFSVPIIKTIFCLRVNLHINGLHQGKYFPTMISFASDKYDTATPFTDKNNNIN